MKRQIFGTDGVRGIANVEPVTAETALKLGRAAAHVFTKLNPREHPSGARPKIVLGKDTRLSGYMLENALVAGIISMGVDVLLIGPLPTPGVAYITRSLRADAGIVLSASHNPYDDNGIKFFRHDGYKLDDKSNNKSSSLFSAGEIDSIRPTAGKIGRATRIDDALGRYVEFAKASFPRGMSLGENAHRRRCGEWRGLQIHPLHFARTGRRRHRRSQRTQRHEHQRGMRQHASGRDSACGQGKRRARSASPTMATPIASCSAMKTANSSMATKFWRSRASIYCKSENLRDNTLVATVMSNFGLDEALGRASAAKSCARK